MKIKLKVVGANSFDERLLAVCCQSCINALVAVFKEFDYDEDEEE